MKAFTCAIVVAFACGLSVSAVAADASKAERGLEIARNAEKQASGYRWYSASGKMILRDRAGTTNVREFTTRSLEMQGDGDRTQIEFRTPLDVRDMALLTHAHTKRDDDQWLYLPALKRVKRITSSSRSGSFAGSEFSYEDLVGHIIEKNDYEYQRDEPCPFNPGRTCHVNAQIPKDPDSGYSRLVGWLDVEDYRTYRVDYFDRRGALIKTMISSEFNRYKDRFWRSHNVVMSNHQTGKSTIMEWSKYDFDTPVRSVDLESYSLGKN